MVYETIAGKVKRQKKPCTMKPLCMAEQEKLVEPVDREQFTGPPSPLENRQVEFGERKGKVDELVTQCYDHTSSLVRQLEGVMWSSRDAGHPASYTNTIRLGDPLSL